MFFHNFRITTSGICYWENAEPLEVHLNWQRVTKFVNYAKESYWCNPQEFWEPTLISNQREISSYKFVWTTIITYTWNWMFNFDALWITKYQFYIMLFGSLKVDTWEDPNSWDPCYFYHDKANRVANVDYHIILQCALHVCLMLLVW